MYEFLTARIPLVVNVRPSTSYLAFVPGNNFKQVIHQRFLTTGSLTKPSLLKKQCRNNTKWVMISSFRAGHFLWYRYCACAEDQLRSLGSVLYALSSRWRSNETSESGCLVATTSRFFSHWSRWQLHARPSTIYRNMSHDNKSRLRLSEGYVRKPQISRHRIQNNFLQVVTSATESMYHVYNSIALGLVA